MHGLALRPSGELSRVNSRPHAAMWTGFPFWSAIFRLCLYVFVLTPCGIHAAHAQAVQNPGAHSSTHVYFLTGLLGVRSNLDELAAKVRQHGLPSTMSSPGGWPESAQSAISEFRSGRLRSIIIVGYSTGAGSALEMASQLNAAKVPVSLVITIDGVSGPPVQSNVRKLINLYVRGGFGDPIARPPGYSGILENIPVEGPNVGHFSIIDAKEPQLLAYVLAAAGSGTPSGRKSERSAVAGPSVSEARREPH
jgi:hypothetical protein